MKITVIKWSLCWCAWFAGWMLFQTALHLMAPSHEPNSWRVVDALFVATVNTVLCYVLLRGKDKKHKQ